MPYEKKWNRTSYLTNIILIYSQTFIFLNNGIHNRRWGTCLNARICPQVARRAIFGGLLATSSPGSCKHGQYPATVVDVDRDTRYVLYNITGTYCNCVLKGVLIIKRIIKSDVLLTSDCQIHVCLWISYFVW